MNKNDIINNVAKFTLRKNDAKKFVETVFDTIKDALISGEKVTIQNFGVFIPKFHKSKKMYEPKKNKYLLIEPRKRIKFIPSKKFLQLLNLKIKSK
ncbi:MAG: HU family DNA-binding protein [Endomicrobia bacterium]|nr:HU family DNA-binding protein [Endomicrobiia bacterium]MCX7941077.1 HU family DNA-binding protein [Endomicrobiia bacterium]MDW8055379.1 HU family DNA-binding protein [Elusimicrobiota bacterium]